MIYPIYNYIQRLLMICQHFVEQKLRFYLWFRLIQLQVEELPQQSTFHVIVYHNINIMIVANISHHLIPSLVFYLHLVLATYSGGWSHSLVVFITSSPSSICNFSTFPFVPFFVFFFSVYILSLNLLNLVLKSIFQFLLCLFIIYQFASLHFGNGQYWNIVYYFCSVLSFLSIDL